MGDKRQKNNDKYEDITSYSKPKGITKGLSHCDINSSPSFCATTSAI